MLHPRGFCYSSSAMLHFAYGTNMSRALMRARCPHAVAIGTTTLRDWRFIINRDGLPSIARQPGGGVHGVLWRLCPRDVAAINAYESVQTGLYRASTLSVCHGPRRVRALVYIARRGGEGAPRPGFIDVVVEAALDWNLPHAYIRSISRRSPARWRGARAKDTGEVG